jgi:DNA-directed RNA polymerase specialized sigma24 family protein
MVRRLTANLALREDLLQEALIHLWLTETRRPGQTKSWYLQSCKYHLLHYLASGRSVDSGKRRAGQYFASQAGDEWDSVPEESDSGNSVLTWVSARDIISLLSPQLLPHEKAVLYCFADGLGPREIGRKLNMSHTMVIKHRRKIASLFHRLELPKPHPLSVRFGSLPLTNGIPANNRTNGHNGSKSRHLANGTGLRIAASHTNLRPLSKQPASLARQPAQLSLTPKPRDRSVRNGFFSFTNR